LEWKQLVFSCPKKGLKEALLGVEKKGYGTLKNTGLAP
jgi:hypothetical protein